MLTHLHLQYRKIDAENVLSQDLCGFFSVWKSVIKMFVFVKQRSGTVVIYQVGFL